MKHTGAKPRKSGRFSSSADSSRSLTNVNVVAANNFSNQLALATTALKAAVHDLKRALALEESTHCDLLGAVGQVGVSDRNSAVRVLRFLKVWFDLPSVVYLSAVNIFDRFLAKMKVNPKYVSCATIGCLLISSQLYDCQLDSAVLIRISQTRCSVQDLDRMAAIIRAKALTPDVTFTATPASTVTTALPMSGDDQPPALQPQVVSVLTFLQLYARYFDAAAGHVRALYTRMLPVDELLNRLEVAVLDAHCASLRPSVLAFALLESEIQRFLIAEIPARSAYYTPEMIEFLSRLVDLHKLCEISTASITSCREQLEVVLGAYETGNHTAAAAGDNVVDLNGTANHVNLSQAVMLRYGGAGVAHRASPYFQRQMRSASGGGSNSSTCRRIRLKRQLRSAASSNGSLLTPIIEKIGE